MKGKKPDPNFLSDLKANTTLEGTTKKTLASAYSTATIFTLITATPNIGILLKV